MLASDQLILGVYAAPSVGGGVDVAAAVVRPVWSGSGSGRRGDLRCIVTSVSRESGPDFVRRLGEELDYPGAMLGSARCVHGVVDVTDPVGGEFLVRAVRRDRRLRRLTCAGKLRVPQAITVVERGRDHHREAYQVTRPALFLPFGELSAARRVEIGRETGTPALLRELAAQLKAASARRPESDDDQREDLARALVAAVWFADAYEAGMVGVTW